MGFFDKFKKKHEPEAAPAPVRNNPNSVFTMRFTIPYFQIFDKTDKALSALPIKMSVTGSCQYRISEPDLCFDNVPLAEMSPEQLEAHVKDALTMNIKTFFNTITTIPLLQFESMIVKISDATKGRVTPILNEEFGINLRAFSISGVRYDVEDPNYLKLQTLSRKVMDNRAKKIDATSEIELEQMKIDSKTTAQRKQEETALELERKKKAHEMELRRQREELDQQSRKNDLELESLRAEQELNRTRLQKEHEIELRRQSEEIDRQNRKADIENELLRAEQEQNRTRLQKEYEQKLKHEQEINDFELEQKRKEHDFELKAEQDRLNIELQRQRDEVELNRLKKEKGINQIGTASTGLSLTDDLLNLDGELNQGSEKTTSKKNDFEDLFNTLDAGVEDIDLNSINDDFKLN